MEMVLRGDKTMLKRILRTVALVLILVFWVGSALAASTVTLEWDASPASEQVIGYRVYQSQTSGSYGSVPVDDVTSGVISVLAGVPDGIYFWVVTAYNSVGESGYSNEATASLVSVPPGAPSTLRIQSVVAQ